MLQKENVVEIKEENNGESKVMEKENQEKETVDEEDIDDEEEGGFWITPENLKDHLESNTVTKEDKKEDDGKV